MSFPSFSLGTILLRQAQRTARNQHALAVKTPPSTAWSLLHGVMDNGVMDSPSDRTHPPRLRINVTATVVASNTVPTSNTVVEPTTAPITPILLKRKPKTADTKHKAPQKKKVVKPSAITQPKLKKVDSAESNITHESDVVIVGSGAAGLTLALSLPKQLKIAVLAKADLTDASTYYAQGGVAAVLDKTDSLDNHIEDTIVAGSELCHPDAVRFTVENGKKAVDFLLEQGVSFTLDDTEQLHLTREGGHSHRRIIHAADATGKAISTTLVEQAKQQPHIQLFTHYSAIDVITTHKLGKKGPNHVVGLYALNQKSNRVETFIAPSVALACGGASKAYLYTSNPDIATGDGIAMAWRAGCRVANMEFNQFHPTCLYHPQARSFLITEAMRGEGAYLRLPDGERFMQRFDDRAELAPRDVVARAIDFEMKRLGIRHVWLDITHKKPEFVKEHFPMLYERLLELGIDITTDMIPVVPAAHYTCGGVMVDEHSQTDIPGLYAIGETSFTGLHGANRMASNSLLECFVYGMSAAEHIAEHQPTKKGQKVNVPAWDASRVQHPDEDVVILQNWDELRHFMWNYVGIVRSTKRLERALNRIQLLKKEIDEYYSEYRISNNLLELRNLVLVAELIIRCALLRTESRGLHYSIDYPNQNPMLQDSVLMPPHFKGSSVDIHQSLEAKDFPLSE